MAGTVTCDEKTEGVSVKKITWDWLSSAGGAADDTTDEFYDGVVWRVVFIPDSGGTQPSAGYNVVINDDNDADILDGGGGGLSNTLTEQLVAVLGLSAVTKSQLTLGVTSAGNA